MEGSDTQSGGRVRLPAGVSIGAGRETAQTNGQGIVVQGTVFPLTLRDGTTTSVFVSHQDLMNPAKVQQLFDERVAALTAIVG